MSRRSVPSTTLRLRAPHGGLVREVKRGGAMEAELRRAGWIDAIGAVTAAGMPAPAEVVAAGVKLMSSLAAVPPEQFAEALGPHLVEMLSHFDVLRGGERRRFHAMQDAVTIATESSQAMIQELRAWFMRSSADEASGAGRLEPTAQRQRASEDLVNALTAIITEQGRAIAAVLAPQPGEEAPAVCLDAVKAAEFEQACAELRAEVLRRQAAAGAVDPLVVKILDPEQPC